MKPTISAIVLAGLFSMTACNRTAVNQKDAAIQAQQHTIDSMNAELAKKKVIDSMNEVARIQYVIPQQAAPAAPATASAATSSRSTSSHRTVRHTKHSSSQSNAGSDVVASSAPASQQSETRKRGWSAKAKGAIIGAGAGAAAGAIINKRNRAAGAVIGGVLGAGAGTGAGAVIDKKKGR